jgi:Zinc carboxypeptidase
MEVISGKASVNTLRILALHKLQSMRYFLVLLFISNICFAQADYFYPKASNFNPAIPTPEKFLGYAIGSHHTRHDKVVEYFKELDRLSDRIVLEEIGYTYEHRVQVTAKVTSSTNHARLEDIRQKNLARAFADGDATTPLVIQLGYNVHGNEPSSTEAAMLTAYYLIANEDEETKKWLNEMVILLDPVYNPDGRDRHTHWANMHKGSPLVTDANDREHNEVWPGGRTNHYWFDLNRDWFLGIHPESKNRLAFFHKWRPYVMTDHHEMGTNSTFYFDPGKSSSNNPIVPSYLYDSVYPKFAEYFSKAMNNIGSLYFTKEAFDKLYPGYGSSYVNFYGGAGFLFEQASSRGHAQETSTIPLTFSFTIRNQFEASLATVRASLGERDMLLKLRRDFYKATSAQAKSNPVKGYVFGDAKDANRTNAFVNLALLHEVEVYELAANLQVGANKFEKGKAFLVPTDQPNYMMVRSLFEKQISYTDSLFYDASTWSVIHGFNLPHEEIKATVAKGDRVKTNLAYSPKPIAKSEYAYAIDFSDYNSHKALWMLQEKKVIVKSAFKPFTASIDGASRSFGYGALLVSVQQQKLSSNEIFEALQEVSKNCRIEVYALNTGYNSEGIDLGSGNFQTTKQPKAAIVVGTGVSGYEVGEVWHLLDQRIGMPITKIDMAYFSRASLTDYSTLVMVGGTYSFDKATIDKIKNWVQAGGTLITLKNASEWVVKQSLVKEKLIVQDTTKTTKRFDYVNAQDMEGARQLGGSIFQIDLDITHPIGFGFSNRKVSIYRNGRTYLQPSKNPYGTVAQYTSKPLIGGYLHKSQLPKIANSAAILVSSAGSGRVIMFTDNPNFRAYWYGTNKLFLNALFFGSVISLPSSEGNAEETED